MNYDGWKNSIRNQGMQSRVGKKKASKLGVSFKKAQNGAGDGTVARTGSGSGIIIIKKNKVKIQNTVLKII